MDPIVVAAEGSYPGPSTDLPAAAIAAAGRSPSRLALARLFCDRTAMVCLGVIVMFVLAAVFAPVLAALEGQSPTALHQDLIDDYGFPTVGPSAEHWFGVEPRLGRDMFARWVYGARPSLLVAGVATVMATVVGLVAGMFAGFVGGWLDRVVSCAHRLRVESALSPLT